MELMTSNGKNRHAVALAKLAALQRTPEERTELARHAADVRWGRPRGKKPISKLPHHAAWRQMIYRCTDPKHVHWKRYGGRGISVCDRWLNSCEAFCEDMGPRPPRHVLDRRDNDGNYEPTNCRWVTHSESVRNRAPLPRRTNQQLTEKV